MESPSPSPSAMSSPSSQSQQQQQTQPGNSIGPQPPRVSTATSKELRFPWKLHLLLERCHDDPAFLDVASWCPDGKSFKVYDKERFVTEVMPLFFGTNHSTSTSSSSSSSGGGSDAGGGMAGNGCATKQWKTFQRNLNLWGFQRISKGPQKDVVSHPLFVRGYPVLSTQMKRCTFKGTGRGNRAPPPLLPAQAKVQTKSKKALKNTTTTNNNKKKKTNSSKLDDLAREASEAYEGLRQGDSCGSTTPGNAAGDQATNSVDGSPLARKTSSSSFIMWPNSNTATAAPAGLHPNVSYPFPPVSNVSSAGETESADVTGMVAKMKQIQKQKELQSLIGQLHGLGTPATAAFSRSLMGTNRGTIAGGAGGLGLIPPTASSVNNSATSTVSASTDDSTFLPHQPMAADSLQADDLISLLQHRKRLIEEQRKQDLELVKRYVLLQQEQKQHRHQQHQQHVPQGTGGDNDNRTALLQLIMAQMQMQNQEPTAAASTSVLGSLGRI